MSEYVTLNEIIKVLGVKQNKNVLTNFRPVERTLMRDAPEFMLESEKGLLVETEIGEGDLITQLLRIVNPKFQTVPKSGEIVKNLRNRMAFDLDRLKLYSKFGYSKMNSFNRQKVYNTLINMNLVCKPDMFDDVFMPVVQYLADYFDINIVVYSCDYKFENLLDTELYFCKRGERLKMNNDLPFVEFIFTTRFCPVVNKDGCGVRKFNERIGKMYENVKMDYIDYKPMAKYKLEQLVSMADERKIELKKRSDKTTKMIKKSKRDLYEDLFYLVDF